MDSVRRRRCETCIFHQPGPTSSTGFCMNQEWQSFGGVQRFVRDRELACYGGWGIDYWKQRPGPPPPLPGTTPGGGGPGPSGGGRPGDQGVMSRYGTIAGGRIVQLRLIASTTEDSPTVPPETQIDDSAASPKPPPPLADDWN